ncbi:putative glyoxalase superfamily protein PhnB [Caulobacter ginsengisoli]|uniref:Glyoxalase superfamily protein PhnB n=1 Tax=Caulobacter ginsengisoli TaxID=400775 RepID=A0ABU0IL81_9CAUL|nr:VOC family protein [Caulobacter ginsengisoli]MDQ0462772.1 putative glyoxalase superfamily protein PhnB [Caulobacter ginsengisoli]
MSEPQASISPALFYRDKVAAIRWLEEAFGFDTTLVVTNPDGQPGHCEMGYGGVTFAIESHWADWTRSPASLGGANTQSIRMTIDGDIDAHCERARAAGGKIITEPMTEYYGMRLYDVVDLEGHVWRFEKVIQKMTLAEMQAAGGFAIRDKL